MSENLLFLVQGSALAPYTVEFIKEGARLQARCTCAAGELGQACKHRLSIIDGDVDNIVSENVAQVALVPQWLKGSRLEESLMALKRAEDLAAVAKREINKAKHGLARAMNEG